jgi:tetratricopeptide (TPR) repeat protein
MQIREIVDSLEKLATSGSFVAEEPKGIYLDPYKLSADFILPSPADDPADQHRKVVADALRILLRLKNDHETLSIQDGALDMFNLSCSLDSLGMWEDAEITCTWAANLYRTLVRGNANPFLPYLAGTLWNLTEYRKTLGDAKGTVVASKETVAMYRMLRDTGADCHIESLALALGRHSQALNVIESFEEGLAAAEESVEILRKLVAKEPEKVADDLDDDLVTLFAELLKLELDEMSISNHDEDIPQSKASEKRAGKRLVNDVIPLKGRLGVALGWLSDCLANTGHDVDAHNAAEESVNILRSISELQPDALCIPLARALWRSSHRLQNKSRHFEALPLMKEAVDLWRKLSQRKPTTFSPILIGALCDFATLLRKTGCDDDALAAGNEAISAYRSFSGDYPYAALYLPDVFDDVDSELLKLGRDEEALALSTEIVATYRKSVSDFPILNHLFAERLHDLAEKLHSANRLEDALVISEEAVDVYRALAKDESDVYSSHLALSLATLARSLYATNRYDEGVAAGNEVVEVHRVFGKARQDVPPKFLTALNRLWRALDEAYQVEDSLVVGAEIICIHRTRVMDHPTNYPGKLVESLLDHSEDLRRNGQYLDGVRNNEETVDLCRSFDCPDAHLDFVIAKEFLAFGLLNLGHVNQAASLCQEAITSCRKLISSQPNSAMRLVWLLEPLAYCHFFKGKFDEAVTAIEEAISLSRDIPSWVDDPDELAYALAMLSVILLKAGKSKCALQASEEAVGVCRAHPKSQSRHVSVTLAFSLHSLSNCLANANRGEEALAAAQEAVNLYQQSGPIYIRKGGQYDFDVADALYDFAAHLMAAGRPAEALEYRREAASMYRSIVNTRPLYLPKFAVILQSLSSSLSEAGHHEQSIEARREEMMVQQRLTSMHPELASTLHHTCVIHRVGERSELEAGRKAMHRLEFMRSKLRGSGFWNFGMMAEMNYNASATVWLFIILTFTSGLWFFWKNPFTV